MPATSRETDTEETVPTVACAPRVMVTPGTTSEKVLVELLAEMPAPRSMEASLPARTVAPPSSGLPSWAVRSKSLAVPVALDSTSRRYCPSATLTTVALRPVSLAGSLMAVTRPWRVPSPVSTSTGEPSKRSSRTRVEAPVTTSERPAASAYPSWWVLATEVTVTVRLRGEAELVVLTPTPAAELEDVRGVHAVSFASASALVASVAVVLLSAWRLERTSFSEETRDLRRFWGAASSCMSWSMMVAVSMPLASPLMLAAIRGRLLSRSLVLLVVLGPAGGCQ